MITLELLDVAPPVGDVKTYGPETSLNAAANLLIKKVQSGQLIINFQPTGTSSVSYGFKFSSVFTFMELKLARNGGVYIK